MKTCVPSSPRRARDKFPHDSLRHYIARPTAQYALIVISAIYCAGGAAAAAAAVADLRLIETFAGRKSFVASELRRVSVSGGKNNSTL